MLDLGFMERAVLAAMLVGLTAPMVGTFLMQRRLSLIGDGLGHVALAGVAAGLATSTAPLWTALLAAVGGAVLIEMLRGRGRTGGDVALATLFYGGIAGAVVIVSVAPSGQSSLNSFLFGAITTTTTADLVAFGVLAACVLVAVLVLRTRLFAVSSDPEYARAVGLPVTWLNLLLAILTAVTVVVSMRVIGLLLISALMIIPNAAAQTFARSFRSTQVLAVVVAVCCAVGGVYLSYYADTPTGGTIVLLTIGLYLLAVLVTAVAHRLLRSRHPHVEDHPHDHGPGCGHEVVVHGDHLDYIHGGHRHAAHGAHYDEH